MKPGAQYVETAAGAGHLSVEPAAVTLEIEEHSHSAMAHAYGAGAAGMMCAARG